MPANVHKGSDFRPPLSTPGMFRSRLNEYEVCNDPYTEIIFSLKLSKNSVKLEFKNLNHLLDKRNGRYFHITSKPTRL